MAGYTRQTLYRYFRDRPTLIRAVAEERVASMGTTVGAYFTRFDRIEPALVDGTLFAVTQARDDQILLTLIDHLTDHSLELQLFRGTPAVREMMQTIWTRLISEAAERGVLRLPSSSFVLDWITNIHAVLYLRWDDYSAAERKSLLRDFFLPSLIRDRGAT